jgi:hypothetical protein
VLDNLIDDLGIHAEIRAQTDVTDTFVKIVIVFKLDIEMNGLAVGEFQSCFGELVIFHV